MSGNVAEVRALTKSYLLGRTRVDALRGVNLTISEGEFLAISGPSGSGKTTLLNILGCLDSPSSGEYILDGVQVRIADFDSMAAFRNEKLGFIFQNFNLIPVLNVYENIEFPMLMRASAFGSPNDRRERIVALAERVGLGGHLNHRPVELSGGQRQRVAVARALATRPRFVLADEPTANLDTETASSLLELMEELNRDEGVTFVFSTHDARILERAHRNVHLVDGRVAKV